jgi:hypothetical protein
VLGAADDGRRCSPPVVIAIAASFSVVHPRPWAPRLLVIHICWGMAGC